jgi:hypothetical protein
MSDVSTTPDLLADSAKVEAFNHQLANLREGGHWRELLAADLEPIEGEPRKVHHRPDGLIYSTRRLASTPALRTVDPERTPGGAFCFDGSSITFFDPGVIHVDGETCRTFDAYTSALRRQGERAEAARRELAEAAHRELMARPLHEPTLGWLMNVELPTIAEAVRLIERGGGEVGLRHGHVEVRLRARGEEQRRAVLVIRGAEDLVRDHLERGRDLPEVKVGWHSRGLGA